MKCIIQAVIAALAAVVFTGCMAPNIKLFTDSADPLLEYTMDEGSDDKILVMSLNGVISDRPKEGLLRSRPGVVQEFVSRLDKARRDPAIKALILKIDSPGGTVTASDILYKELLDYKEATGVKVIVVMMNVAASGGYYAALPADYILAHPTTLTGSVGVIFMTPDFQEVMDKIGVGMNVTKSGDKKDMGSPWRKRTPEEEKIFQDLIDTMATRFKDKVVKHRSLSDEAIETVTSARVFLPDEAKELGLIDGIGYLSDAVPKASELASLDSTPTVVVYRRTEHADDNMYNSALNRGGSGTINLIDTGLSHELSSMRTGLYYLWLPGTAQ